MKLNVLVLIDGFIFHYNVKNTHPSLACLSLQINDPLHGTYVSKKHNLDADVAPMY